MTDETPEARFVAYSKTYQRFVGPVCASEDEAKAAAKARGYQAKDIEVRDVTQVNAELHGVVAFATAAAVETDTEGRTITGIAVPWGQAGRTSAGVLSIKRGSLRLPDDLKRVKLMDQHQEPPVAVGYATAAEDTDTGLRMTFKVAKTDAGDRALLEASEGVRDALSVELVDLTVDGETVTAADLSAVAQVAVPAYANARVETVAASQSTGPVRTVERAAAPAMLAPVAGAGRRDETRELPELFAAVQRVLKGVSRPNMEAALADITGTDIFGTVGTSSYVGQLWGNLGYTRRFVPLLNHGNLTSWEVKGWKWGTKPEVGDYAGDKAAIPSNGPVTVVPASTEAARLAGGHDLDRKFRDFGDTEFLAAYFAAMTESYARKSDAKARAFLLASASSAGATASGAGILAAALLAADTLEDNTDGQSPDYILVNRTDRRTLLDVNAHDVPAFLDMLGVNPRQFIASSDVTAGTVVAGVKNAGTFYELPGSSPVRVEALDIANGGVDEAVFGYWATLLHDSKGIVKATITP
jgi:phage head maturation protease